ncbi:MAG: DUF4157 domain-containing protein [Myxococcota bacterium]|nr:DUF4157 domain-containing protein [Myxococcota bacterium]
MPRAYPGEDLVDRLFDREEEGGLRRVTVPGQGEAYTGPAATRALKALGGEAMTVDNTIIVPEDFDPARPEHAALYAHEQYHVEHGRDGQLSHAIHDAEEVAARAVERMVLHRMKGGETGIQPGGGNKSSDTLEGAGGHSAEADQGPDEKPASLDSDPDPIAGYWALRKMGMSHQDVVDKIARDILSGQDDASQASLGRFGDMKKTI